MEPRFCFAFLITVHATFSALEKWDGLLMKNKLLIFSYQFSGCKHSISVSLNHTVLECLSLELYACSIMPGFYMDSGDQNSGHHADTLPTEQFLK